MDTSKRLLREAQSQRDQINANTEMLPHRSQIFRNAYQYVVENELPGYFYRKWCKKYNMDPLRDRTRRRYLKYMVHVDKDDGNTRLHEFVDKDKTTILYACLTARKSPIFLGSYINWPNKSHATPLIVAIFKNHYEAAAVLLESGADPNHQISTSHPAPLHYAVRVGDLDMVNLLLNFHADPTLRYFDKRQNR